MDMYLYFLPFLSVVPWPLKRFDLLPFLWNNYLILFYLILSYYIQCCDWPMTLQKGPIFIQKKWDRQTYRQTEKEAVYRVAPQLKRNYLDYRAHGIQIDRLRLTEWNFAALVWKADFLHFLANNVLYIGRFKQYWKGVVLYTWPCWPSIFLLLLAFWFPLLLIVLQGLCSPPTSLDVPFTLNNLHLQIIDLREVSE